MYYTVILKHRASPDKAEEYLKKAVETIELVPNKAHKAAQLLLSQMFTVIYRIVWSDTAQIRRARTG